MSGRRFHFAAFVVGLQAALSTAAEPEYRPAPENLAARAWFQDAKFGLFVHWGLYAQLGDGEWVLNNHKMPVAEYEKLAPTFNPTAFDPAEWVALVKAAGMKYIVITAKHHDGFCLFATKQTDWNILERTPYKRDVMKMLADECRKQGVKLFFYYSHLDWRHPDYFPPGRTGRNTDRKPAGDWNRYLDFVDAQLTELLTNYGEIGGIWFDGWWDKKDADWRLRRTYDLIHKLQPGCLVGNNHHVNPFPGEDFQMFEKDLPGGNTTGFNEAGISALPLESCETINRAWGYNKSDRQFKSTAELIRMLVLAAGHNANFLLNVGPQADGKIQPECVERLRAVGQWLERNGESVTGTRGGPFPPQSWGAATIKGDRVYVHVLRRLGTRFVELPKMNRTIKSATLLHGGAVEWETSKDGVVTLTLPPNWDNVDQIVVLETSKR
jgi:alpha-L-fucosidase